MYAGDRGCHAAGWLSYVIVVCGFVDTVQDVCMLDVYPTIFADAFPSYNRQIFSLKKNEWSQGLPDIQECSDIRPTSSAFYFIRKKNEIKIKSYVKQNMYI